MKKEIFRKSTYIINAIVIFAGILRVPFLDQYPPSLYSDEVSQGYNAYSVLKTGSDEYGQFLPISFRSFGDWKPPLQTYFMVPTIWIFGLNAYGVRLPSALLGTLTILLVYFLTKEFFAIFEVKNSNLPLLNNKNKEKIALLVAILLAISPLHIHQSRSAMLVCVELFFLTLAIFSFLKGLTNQKWWVISSIAWVLGIYSYYGMRVIAPIFILFLLFCFHKSIFQNKKNKVIVPIFIGLILLLPLFWMFVKQPNIVLGRAKTVSIFHDKGTALLVWDLIAQDGLEMPSKLAQLLHNKPYHYMIDITRRFFQHIDGRFLFLIGDKHPPFQIPGMGILYLIDGVFILIGIVWLLRNNWLLLRFLLFWIVVSIIPASLTFVTPAANRTFTMVVPFMTLNAFGIFFILQKINFRKIIIALLIFGYVVSFGYFGYQYFIITPKDHADMWHFGYKELYAYLQTQENSYETIYISGKSSVPYIFYLFNQQVDPKLAQKTIKHNFKDDEFGFEHVDQVSKYYFPRYFNWEVDKYTLLPNSLLVTTGQEIVGEEAKKIYEVQRPNRSTAFTIYEVSQK